MKYLLSCGRGTFARLWLDKAETWNLSDIFFTIIALLTIVTYVIPKHQNKNSPR